MPSLAPSKTSMPLNCRPDLKGETMSQRRKISQQTTKDWGPLAILALAVLTVVGAVMQTSAEPGKGVLLGVSPEENDLLEIRYPRGRAFPLLPLGFPASGIGVDVLTQDATTDVAFLGRGSGGSSIYRADLQLAAVALVGDTGGSSTSVHGMDFMSLDATTDAYSFPATTASGQPAAGVLFAALNLQGTAESGGDHLAMIDTATGAATLVGPMGLDGVEALAFDADGTLWAGVSARSSSTPGLYTVDLDLGLATFYATLDNVGPNGPPGPPSGGLASLTFGCDGILWGGTAEAIAEATESTAGSGAGIVPGQGPLIGGLTGPLGLGKGLGGSGEGDANLAGPTDGGRLLAIDPTSGYFQYARRQSVRRGDLGGLAFDQPCLTLLAPVPGVSNAVNELLLIGGTAGGRHRVFAGFDAGSSSVSVAGCGQMTLGIDNARPRETRVANADGETTFEMFFPRGFSGRTLFFQAIDRNGCTTSNLGAVTLPWVRLSVFRSLASC